MNEGALAGDHLKHIHALITVWSLVDFKDRGAPSYAGDGSGTCNRPEPPGHDSRSAPR